MGSTQPLASLLVPVYNAAAYLKALCQSIQAQSYPNFEAIFLDDGSTDNSREIFAPFLSDPRFRLLAWQKNRGLGAGFSKLLGEAQGKYWCSPGADDVLFPGFLKRRVEMLEAHPEAVLVHGRPEIINETGAVVPNGFKALPFPEQMEGARALSVVLQHNIINQPSTLVRTELTRRVLPFFDANFKYTPDWYLWILHLATGFDLLWDGECAHQYRVHSASLSLDPAKDAIRRAEIRLTPLCALSAASRYSPLAAGYWVKWGGTLNCLWLQRAMRWQAQGRLPGAWRDAAAYARRGVAASQSSLWVEAAINALGVAGALRRERAALKRQSFRVSGLAEIDDPLFR